MELKKLLKIIVKIIKDILEILYFTFYTYRTIIMLLLILLAIRLLSQNKSQWTNQPIHNINAKIATSQQELRQGLMFVKYLPPDEGMLFVYPKIAKHSFWMKNTYIPIDVIYMNSNYEVIGMILNNRPHDLQSKGIDKPSKYFLEVNAGYVERKKIKLGDRMLISAST